LNRFPAAVQLPLRGGLSVWIGDTRMEWMLVPFKRYADFSGRSRRMEYWMYQVFTLMIYVVCGGIMLAGLPWSQMSETGTNYDPNAMPGPAFWVGMTLAVLWYLFTFIPDIAVTVRRFHDQDLSGWMYLLRFIPYVGGLVVLVFMCIDGHRQANRFGSDPKDDSFDAGVFS
jgi:uncharacterized membrane protein YhaH (DUF805 family)